MLKNAWNLMILLPSAAKSRKVVASYRHLMQTHTFAESNGREVQLDLYMPEEASGPVPLIIWFHGGAWKMGSKKDIEPGIIKQLDRGYAVASLNYTLSKNAKWPVQAHEVKAGIRFLRANAAKLGVDPDCFIAAGMSAGGHLASIAGVTSHTKHLEGDLGFDSVSSHVHGVMSWYGPSDFLQMGDLGIADHDKANSPESELIGAPIQTVPEKTRAANPVSYLHENVPPFYLAHGSWDRLVNPNQSKILAEALQKAGLEVIYNPLDKFVHGDYRFNSREHMKEVEKFLDRIISK